MIALEPGPRSAAGRQISAQHVLDAVRQIDEIHDAEYQRQAGRDQEQQHAKLQAVEDLDQKERGGHRPNAAEIVRYT